ncbi:hypothetical protein ACNFJ7_04065 [Sphingomonas sp. HT-1]|uniref:hypothetical protein n=1 Tax=unclassified Sphingomonas TaxID=196159 RepID=UPI0002F0B4C0|nr:MULTISPECIES: hypothetical protein [unclassified Sphingomonas]KTF67305.1 hypothetical protein ATB93_18090 [Sphingomonas sp. WG]
MRSLSLLAASAVFLAGCGQSGTRYPSLLPRTSENAGFIEPERPVPVAGADAELDSQVAALVNTIETADRDFAAAARDAETKVARAKGSASGSSAWLDAQAALSALDSLHARASVALADLDKLAIDRGAAGMVPYPALNAAIARAGERVAAQEAQAQALEAAINGG